jgi:hypothetical protein
MPNTVRYMFRRIDRRSLGASQALTVSLTVAAVMLKNDSKNDCEKRTTRVVMAIAGIGTRVGILLYFLLTSRSVTMNSGFQAEEFATQRIRISNGRLDGPAGPLATAGPRTQVVMAEPAWKRNTQVRYSRSLPCLSSP